MDRRAALVLLATCALAVFLSGLELMVTAVALPAIVPDLASWSDLRHASWIVNGYLLVSIVSMPLAGRLADRHGARPLLLAGLAAFTLGSLLAAMAPSLDTLIAARLVQGLGAGTIVPVATAAASHLFEGHLRPRALGVVGAATFLGMAAGPFVGAAVLRSVHPAAALEALGLAGTPLVTVLAPAWRWVFYLDVPFGLAALVVAWAASAGWDTSRRHARVDIPGAIAFSIGLGGLLLGLTLLGGAGSPSSGVPVPGALIVAGLVGLAIAVALDLRARDPFVDVRAFRRPAYAAAALVSLLTGYGLATAIIGAAVFVDRVLYGGPETQEVALGALAGATAVGAFASGLLVRRLSLTLITVVGLVGAATALAAMASWGPGTDVALVAALLALFGLGFGVTVTPRSTAAVEAVGRDAFGAASATVTVARMLGMAVGLAILTAYGSTTIERLTAEVYATPTAYREFLPPALRSRPRNDGLVVQALESWASGEAARVLGGVFIAAAGVTLVAIGPALLLRGRPRILEARRKEAPVGGDGDGTAASLAL
ncbi:MAG TPA: MFS transporter [Candidatus Dormibacteraeota bacterium]|nr:MFS transporter [Candidatus Dormibacteraeota bacterium]